MYANRNKNEYMVLKDREVRRVSKAWSVASLGHGRPRTDSYRGMSPVFAWSSSALVGKHDRVGKLLRCWMFCWRSEGKK